MSRDEIVRGKAAEGYQCLLALFEKTHGHNYPNMAGALSNLATFATQRGHYTKTEVLLRRAPTIYELNEGKESTNVASSLNNLGSLFVASGAYPEAESALIRAIEIEEKLSASSSELLATSLTNLGHSYVQQLHYDRAEPLVRRALEINERFHGPNHPDVASTLGLLAVICEETGRRRQAAHLRQRAAAIIAASRNQTMPLTNRPASMGIFVACSLVRDQSTASGPHRSS